MGNTIVIILGILLEQYSWERKYYRLNEIVYMDIGNIIISMEKLYLDVINREHGGYIITRQLNKHKNLNNQ